MYIYIRNSSKVINAVEWPNKSHSANATLIFFFYFSSRRVPQKGKQSEWKCTEFIEKRGVKPKSDWGLRLTTLCT